jgi:hypothetical protein
LSCALPLSYARLGDGTRTRDFKIYEGTPTCASGRHRRFQGARQLQRHRVVMAARPGFEPGPPGSEPGVVPVPPSRIGLDGEIRTPNLRSPTPARFQLHHVQVSTDGGSRTRTDGVLSAAPLPVGLRQQVCRCVTQVDRAGFEPAPFSLRGRRASGYATGPWMFRCVGREGGNRTRGQGV